MDSKLFAIIALLSVLASVLSKPLQDGPPDLIKESEAMELGDVSSLRVKRDIMKAPCPEGNIMVLGKCVEDDPDYGR